MALTTYTAGEVLTAASLNANLTFAAANPPASAAGLSFISSTAFTTATSASLPVGTFNSTFDNYKLVLSLTALSAASVFSLRFRVAGADNTDSLYNTMFTAINTAGGLNVQFANGQTSIGLGESAAAFANFYNLVIDVNRPFLAQVTGLSGTYQFIDVTSAVHIGRTGNANQDTTTSYDSLSFISSVASSMTGTVTVYGYANS